MTTIVFAVVLGTGLGVFALSLSKDGSANPSGGDHISVSASGSGPSAKAGEMHHRLILQIRQRTMKVKKCSRSFFNLCGAGWKVFF